MSRFSSGAAAAPLDYNANLQPDAADSDYNANLQPDPAADAKIAAAQLPSWVKPVAAALGVVGVLYFLFHDA